MPQLSTTLNVAYGINAVIAKNESLELVTGREPLYGNWIGRGKREHGERGGHWESVRYSCMTGREPLYDK